ncbi:MAG: methylated-DNA--[protein]-cysteine S-methyltransferase [Calditrichaeota bacterium]|nr:MAG: methylated-DNA--[protein]-cysteine S-methyltransferase [Calditrichota bacterium]
MQTVAHISENDFIAFFCHEMDGENKHIFQQHLQKCQQCIGDFETYQNIFDGMQTIFQSQGKEISPSQMHTIMLEETQKRKIYYSRLNFSGFPSISAAMTNLGLVKIFLGEMDLFKLDERLNRLFPGKWLIHSEEALYPVQKQLQEYFNKRRTSFDLQLDRSLIKGDFQSKVLDEIMHLGFGEHLTYGELAKRINQPTASRAVGNALGKNPIPIIIPCHRILAGHGQLGGFTGGIELKKELLKIENIYHSSVNDQLSLF